MNAKLTLVLVAGLLLSGPAMAQGHVTLGQYSNPDDVVAVAENIADLFGAPLSTEQKDARLCSGLKDLINKYCDPMNATDVCDEVSRIRESFCSD